MTVGEDGLFTLPGTSGGPCMLRVTAQGFLSRIVPQVTGSRI